MVEKEPNDLPADEIARRMERGIRRFLNTPPQPRGKNPKLSKSATQKERAALKRRMRKGKMRS
jgi:hypothetical protein